MITKIYRLFGIKIIEIVTLEQGEQPVPKGKPRGEVLNYTPLEEQVDKDKETIKKMKG